MDDIEDESIIGAESRKLLSDIFIDNARLRKPLSSPNTSCCQNRMIGSEKVDWEVISRDALSCK